MGNGKCEALHWAILVELGVGRALRSDSSALGDG